MQKVADQFLLSISEERVRFEKAASERAEAERIALEEKEAIRRAEEEAEALAKALIARFADVS
jgi:hypothetical protein